MRAKTKKAGATADAAARGGLPAGAGWLWKREACGEGWEKLWAKATSKRIVLFNDEQVRQKRDSEREGRSPGPGPLSARCTSALSIGGARGGTPRAAPRPLAFPPWRTCVITSSPFFVWLALPRRRRGPWTCWSCSTPPCRRSPSAASSPAACAATRAASRCARAARTPPPAAAAPARPAPRAPRGAWPTCRAAPPTCKPCATSSWSWRQRGPRSTRPGCVSGRCSRRPWFRCLLCVLRQLVVALVGARLVACLSRALPLFPVPQGIWVAAWRPRCPCAPTAAAAAAARAAAPSWGFACKASRQQQQQQQWRHIA